MRSMPVRSMPGGGDYDPPWLTRQRGTGAYAHQISQRFRLACRPAGVEERSQPLPTDLFRRSVIWVGRCNSCELWALAHTAQDDREPW
jgi:hypothetical protein